MSSHTLDLSGAGTSLGMVGSGLIGDESDTTTENAEELETTIDMTVTEPAETAREQTSPDALGEWARNLGPDWLDEATIVIGILVLLVVLRPYVEAGNTAADAVTG